MEEIVDIYSIAAAAAYNSQAMWDRKLPKERV
jgi:hypothetical protein